MVMAVDLAVLEALPPGAIFMQDTTATASKASHSRGVLSDFIRGIEQRYR
jgi:hypothetical protein